MKLSVTKQFKFSAGHVLHDPEYSPEENESVFGKCSRQHGHNYVLEVTVGVSHFPHDAGLDDGMVINFYEIAALVNKLIIDRWDHRVLNDVADFAGILTTAENMAQVAWDIVESGLDDARKSEGARLECIRVQETDTGWATFARSRGE